MNRIKIYKPPDGLTQAADFIEGPEPKLRTSSRDWSPSCETR